jgi:hypothetical protein
MLLETKLDEDWKDEFAWLARRQVKGAIIAGGGLNERKDISAMARLPRKPSESGSKVPDPWYVPKIWKN